MAIQLRFYLSNFFNNSVHNALYFYPDDVYFPFSKTQYQREWAKLSQVKGSYLSVQYGRLNRVGWLHYNFEQMKSWLGFNHSCQPEKIQMAAQKLAYYGYLNGFNEESTLDVINAWDSQYQPLKEYLDSCKISRNNETSADLQQQLITFYRNNAHQLNALDQRFTNLPLPHIDPWYKFGITPAMRGNFVAMAQLDVQDEGLINDYVQQFANGNITLENSTCRRLYVGYTLSKIQSAFGEIIQTQSTGAWILGTIRNYFLQQPKSVLSDLEYMHQDAKTTLALWPDLEKNHFDILINLKLELARQLKQAGELRDIPQLYREAFSLITQYYTGLKAYNYMSRYFLEEGAFATQDVTSAFIQSWGEHLFKNVLPSASSGEKYSLCAYRIAQIRADLIPNDSLGLYIDSCLHAKNYKLAYTLIERLAETHVDRSVKYISGHSADLSSFLKTDTRLSQAYAKQVEHDSQSYLARFSLFVHGSDRVKPIDTTLSTKKDATVSGVNAEVRDEVKEANVRCGL